MIKTGFQRGLFHILGVNFFVQFLNFGLVIFVAGYLSKSDLGDLKLIQSYAVLFIMLGAFGYDSSALKLCSENISCRQKTADLSFAFTRVLKFSLLSVIAFNGLSYSYISAGDSRLLGLIGIYSILVIFTAFSYLSLSFLQSQKMVKKAAMVQFVTKLIFVAAVFVSAYFWQLEGIIISTVLAAIVGLLVYYPFVRKYIDFGLLAESRSSQVNKYAYAIVFGAVLTLVSQNLDIYLLDYFSANKEDIGVYSIATIYYTAAVLVISTMQTFVLPYFSEKSGDIDWIKQRAVRYQLVFVAVSVIVCVGVMLFAKVLDLYYFSDGYQDAFYLGLILLCKFFCWSGYSVLGIALFAQGIIKPGIYLVAVGIVINLVLSFWLYDAHGYYGVATSQAVTALVSFFLAVAMFMYYIGCRPNASD
nr:oligosaccharide flippase family protein [Motiliproteus sediminis]